MKRNLLDYTIREVYNHCPCKKFAGEEYNDEEYETMDKLCIECKFSPICTVLPEEFPLDITVDEPDANYECCCEVESLESLSAQPSIVYGGIYNGPVYITYEA